VIILSGLLFVVAGSAMDSVGATDPLYFALMGLVVGVLGMLR
jgi:hypothetical protein